jgi:hypothetical protein
MDQTRFDSLVRTLSACLSRRQTLAVLVAALSGSALLSVLPDEAAAMSKKARRRCKRKGGEVCSSGTRASEYCCLDGTCLPTAEHGTLCCGPVMCEAGDMMECCPPGPGWQCCPEGSIFNCVSVDDKCCEIGSAFGSCPADQTCCEEGSGEDCCPEGKTCSPAGCVDC